MIRFIRLAAAVVAGLAMWAAFPPSNLWFLAVATRPSSVTSVARISPAVEQPAMSANG